MRRMMTMVAGGLAALAGVSPARAAEAPVLIELFTSQGCSSCPPADALLGELARRPNVIALAFHVDYWDRLGWRDPYASSDATRRQYRYASWFGSNQVYTPQLVVGGAKGVVGSDRSAAEAAIAEAARHPSATNLQLTRAADALRVTVGAGAGRGRVWLAAYDPRRETSVRAGENGGAKLEEFQLVRRFESIGDWTGGALALTATPPSEGQGVAVFIQGEDGRILASAALAPAAVGG